MVHLGKTYVFVEQPGAPSSSAPVWPRYRPAPPIAHEHHLSDQPAPRVGGGFATLRSPLIGWPDPYSADEHTAEAGPPQKVLQLLASATPPAPLNLAWCQTAPRLRFPFAGPISLETSSAADQEPAKSPPSLEPECSEETVEVELVTLPDAERYTGLVFHGFLRAHERSGWNLSRFKSNLHPWLAIPLSLILAILPRTGSGPHWPQQDFPVMASVSNSNVELSPSHMTVTQPDSGPIESWAVSHMRHSIIFTCAWWIIEQSSYTRAKERHHVA